MDSPAGYLVFRGLISPRLVAEALAAARAAPEDDWAMVFKTLEPKKTYDEKRHQLTFDAQFMTDNGNWLTPINKEVRAVADPINPNYVVKRPWVFLRSRPGGDYQHVHRDFMDREVGHYAEYPASAIVALQDGTKISTFGWERRYARADEENVVEMDAGDVVIFRGDLIHRGVPYGELNYRLHCFLDINGLKVKEDRTQPVHFAQYLCSRCTVFSADTPLDLLDHVKTCFVCVPCQKDYSKPQKEDKKTPSTTTAANSYHNHMRGRHSDVPRSKKPRTQK